MAHRTTWKDKYLGIVMQAVLLCGTINISLVFGQASLFGPAFGSSPSGNMFVTYFGDNQSTTAIGATMTLPQCSGTLLGQSNLFLRLENTDTGVVLQQVGPFTGITGFLWNTTAISTLTPSLTGSYVCRLYQNSNSVATSGHSYQLNVVVSMRITCQYPTFLNYESMNVISCTVTGYPQPMVSWNTVNGSTTSTTPATLSGGIYNITSTLSVVGNQAVSAPGLKAMVIFTAEYVEPFNCTMVQDNTIQENICELIPDTVTEPLRPLVVAQCGPINDPAFNSTPSIAMNYTSSFSFGCATNYTLLPGSLDINPSRCQANGTWSTLPNCVATTSTNSPTTFGATTSTNSPTTFGATTSTNSPTTSGARVGSDALPSWVIPVAVVSAVLLLLLIVLFIGCYLKRSPPPRNPKLQASSKTPQLQADLTINAAYEDATTVSNAMTKSSAYELAAVPNQPNYDFIQPTQPIEYDYVTPR